ncbi:hypothetical protein F5J12DRAFT_209711 [Pisolithus orientalis]|uniref:uncharacterized protein n=1 Tax=Pisolithus orientalis TaxID=936130 RepID=UPI0022246BCE|nr:uncharacterized protein F5J12DRAFT_209711 [Pisolithus orientalis]KAI6002671.1 hypothetical protein F5J12DRAFT_209711 [Pisolithus orientalis]
MAFPPSICGKCNVSHYRQAIIALFPLPVSENCPPSTAGALTHYSQALQSPSRSTTLALLPVPNFSPVGHSDEEQDVSHLPSILPSSHHITRVRGSHYRWSILPAKMDHHLSARTYRTAPPAITNHIATLSFPHTSILPPYVIGQSSRYPREIVNNSMFGDPGRVSVGPMMELSSVTPPCMITPQALCSTQMHHGRGLQAAYRPHFRNGIYRMTSPTTTFRFL